MAPRSAHYIGELEEVLPRWTIRAEGPVDKFALGDVRREDARPAEAPYSSYTPSPEEPFMNCKMRNYFRQNLLAWRDALLRESVGAIENLKDGGNIEKDISDRATIETERALQFKTGARAANLIVKINAALQSIEDGTYGYCEETGEPIGFSRLVARPIATLSIEARERHERVEKTHLTR
jgi:DnaK suppressor protein